jgi:hypothetical protein
VQPWLLANPSLTSVNLADNRIGSFKEIAAVARLPKLKELCFADPHWGDNPVSTLCNYQTYVLFTIPSLAVLDTLPLAEETKALAEATYMKKKMYYNMVWNILIAQRGMKERENRCPAPPKVEILCVVLFSFF